MNLSTCAAIAGLASLGGLPSALGQVVHYSPEDDLAQIDAQLIGSAKTSIDFASYALTDRVIITALNSADHRGVAIQIVLDPRERLARADASAPRPRTKPTSAHRIRSRDR